MWHNLVNTIHFSEAANDFRKNQGVYTKAPRGSREYFEYWELQAKRCKEGYSVGDTWIPGRYYFYLNFFPMYKVDDKVALTALDSTLSGKVSKRTAEKIMDFPRFNEMQYEWWMFKHIAWNGGTFMGIDSPGGKHICCAKTRGAGFSYMEAADGIYNYNFIPGSKSYYFASRETYLTSDGILNKVIEGLDFLNLHSSYWKKNRQKKSEPLHYRSSFIDGFGTERGFKSEIIGQTVDNPNKTRGKRGRKITFEEFGSFKNGKQAVEIALGSLRDGDMYVGQMSVFGTGGEEGPEIEALEEMFTDPHAWDMLAFPNIWEENGSSSEVGYFVPCWRGNFKYTDKDGNILMKEAIASDDIEREKKSKSKDPKVLDARKAEYPRKPSELFQRLTNNGFNVGEVTAQIKRIQSSSAIQALLRHGNVISSESSEAMNGVEFVINPDAAPVDQYPHKSGDNLEGCVTICERPYKDQNGHVPPGMYQIVFDAYYKDGAEDLTSLFDITVLKQDNPYDNSMVGLPVAWYTGRPKSLRTCHETLFNLAALYNCTIQGEISGGGQAVVDFAKARRLLHKIEFEPDMMHNKEIASNQKNKSYLMNMSTDRKKLGMTYLEDWHMLQRGINQDGTPIYNVHKIYKIGLLEEMKRGGVKNSDRMSSMIIGMFMLKENIVKQINRVSIQSDFFDRTLFSGNASEDNGETTSLY